MADPITSYLDFAANPSAAVRSDASAAPAGNDPIGEFLHTAADPVGGYVRSQARSGGSFEDVSGTLQKSGLDPKAFESQFRLEAARGKAAKMDESSWLDNFTGPGAKLLGVSGQELVRKGIPGSSAVASFALEREFAQARDRIAAGKPEQKDYDFVAQYERIQQLDQERSQGLIGGLREAAVRAPAILGEAYATGGASFGPRAGAGALERLGVFAANRAAVTPLQPSLYLAETAKRATEQGGEPYDLKNAAPPLAMAALQNLVLGSVAKLGGAQTLPTRAGRSAVAGVAGVGEQAGADVAGGVWDEVAADSYKTKTRYGVLGDLARGEPDKAATHAAVQALTFASFSALHGREANPAETIAPALDSLAKKGMSKEKAAAVVNDAVAGKIEAPTEEVQKHVDTVAEATQPANPVVQVKARGEGGTYYRGGGVFSKVPEISEHLSSEPAAAEAMGLLGNRTVPVELGEVKGQPALTSPDLGEHKGIDQTDEGAMNKDQVANLGLSEWLIHAADRNGRNYVVPRGENKVVGIDYAEAWHPGNFRDPNAVVGPGHSDAVQKFGKGKVDVPERLIRDAIARGPELERLAAEGTAGLGPEAQAEAVNLVRQKIEYLKSRLGKETTLSHLPEFEGLKPETELPKAPEPVEPPPPKEGMVRFYHGGVPGEGPRWLTPYREYAEGYAAKSNSKVQYVDIPETDPRLQKVFDDTGTNMKSPYSHFEAPEEITRNLKELPLRGQKASEPAKPTETPTEDEVLQDRFPDLSLKEIRSAMGEDLKTAEKSFRKWADEAQRHIESGRPISDRALQRAQQLASIAHWAQRKALESPNSTEPRTEEAQKSTIAPESPQAQPEPGPAQTHAKPEIVDSGASGAKESAPGGPLPSLLDRMKAKGRANAAAGKPVEQPRATREEAARHWEEVAQARPAGVPIHPGEGRAIINDAIAAADLSADHRAVLDARLQGKTLQEIGDSSALGRKLTRERIRQIEGAALDKLGIDRSVAAIVFAPEKAEGQAKLKGNRKLTEAPEEAAGRHGKDPVAKLEDAHDAAMDEWIKAYQAAKAAGENPDADPEVRAVLRELEATGRGHAEATGVGPAGGAGEGTAGGNGTRAGRAAPGPGGRPAVPAPGDAGGVPQAQPEVGAGRGGRAGAPDVVGQPLPGGPGNAGAAGYALTPEQIGRKYDRDALVSLAGHLGVGERVKGLSKRQLIDLILKTPGGPEQLGGAAEPTTPATTPHDAVRAVLDKAKPGDEVFMRELRDALPGLTEHQQNEVILDVVHRAPGAREKYRVVQKWTANAERLKQLAEAQPIRLSNPVRDELYPVVEIKEPPTGGFFSLGGGAAGAGASKGLGAKGGPGPTPGVADEVRTLLAPATRSEPAKVGGNILRTNNAILAHKKAVAEQALKAGADYFDDLVTKAAGDEAKLKDLFLAFTDPIQSGTIGQMGAEMKAMAETVRKLYDERTDAVTDRKIIDPTKLIENYITQLWADPKRPDATPEEIGRQLGGRRPLAGKEGFKKERFYETYRDGIEAGLVPKDWNPVRTLLAGLHQIDKSVMAHDTVQELKENGLWEFVRLGGERNPGWQHINDKIATVFAPPEARVKEYVDKQQMEGLEKFAEKLGISVETARDSADVVRRGMAGGLGAPVGKRGGQLGASFGDTVVRRFGTPEEILAHEIGHQLDDKYGMARGLQAPGLAQEMEALAKLRASGRVSPEYAAYLQQPNERAANLVTAYLHAPELLRKVAPLSAEWFDALIASHPELHPIRDIKPSLELEERDQMMRLAGPMLTGHWTTPGEVATLLNNHLSPGLYGQSKIYEGVRTAANVLNGFQLGFSAFHAGFVTMDAQVSAVALGLKQISRGDFSAGLKTLAGGAVPGLAPVRSFLLGTKLGREYFKPGSQGAEVAGLVDALEQAGGRARMDAFYGGTHLDAFRKALRAVQLGNFGKVPHAMLNALPALSEAIQKPVMEFLVPRMKMGVFAEAARYELDRNPNMTREQLRDTLGKTWDSVENRLGQLTYDNLFWNRTVKDLLMLGVRSVGWNVGTVRELAGGLRDIPRAVRDVPAGRGVSDRLAYTAALPMVAALWGAIYGYLNGQPPQELKDYFFPRTGRKRKDGSDDRVSLPSYVRDVAALTNRADEGPERILSNAWGMAKHKTNPLIGTVAEMLENQDFYGKAIYNPADPSVTKARDLAAHVLKAFEPFAVRGYNQQEKQGAPVEQRVQSFFGVTPAPSYVVHSSEEQRKAEEKRKITLTPIGKLQQERKKAGVR